MKTPSLGESVRAVIPSERESCTRCSRCLTGQPAFALGEELRCLRCALSHRPLLRRSALTSIVVGSILAMVNQGPALLAGHFRPEQVWQVGLNYAVPFGVATWGGLINSRRMRCRTRECGRSRECATQNEGRKDNA